MKRPPFVNESIYHIYNRGVEKRNVFLDEKDHLRFINNLSYFNDKNINAVSHNLRRDVFSSSSSLYEVEPRTGKVQEPFVDIFAFVLMPNHFHLLMKQRTENGVVKFMQKLGTGYTMYFNTKYERVGSLFQGKFKAVLVERDAHLLYLPHYIHFNPLDLIPVRGRTSYRDRIRFLENYRWSSFPDYIGKKNFPFATRREFLCELFGDRKRYEKEAREWLRSKERVFDLTKEVLLED